jgi:hypothetical protein
MFRRGDFEASVLEQLRSRSPESWGHAVTYKHREILKDAAATVFVPSNLSTRFEKRSPAQTSPVDLLHEVDRLAKRA